MPRIFRALKEFFSAAPVSRKAVPARRARLGLETLEGRALPSVSPIPAPVGPAPVIGQSVTLPIVVDVPNIRGDIFHLFSSNNQLDVLAIKTETYHNDGSASLTGTFTSGGKTSAFTNGSLKFNAQGNAVLSFSFSNGQGAQDSFTGTLTRVSTPFSFFSFYHLDGTVTTSAGSVHVSGNSQSPVFPLAAN
jgi:hypothetical protein